MDHEKIPDDADEFMSGQQALLCAQLLREVRKHHARVSLGARFAFRGRDWLFDLGMVREAAS
jgi:hypothetical protein